MEFTGASRISPGDWRLTAARIGWTWAWWRLSCQCLEAARDSGNSQGMPRCGKIPNTRFGAYGVIPYRPRPASSRAGSPRPCRGLPQAN